MSHDHMRHTAPHVGMRNDYLTRPTTARAQPHRGTHVAGHDTAQCTAHQHIRSAKPYAEYCNVQ